MRRSELRSDPDGVTVRHTGRAPMGMWLLVPALALIGLMLFVLIGPLVANPDRTATREPASHVAAAQLGSRKTSNQPARSAAADAHAAALSRRPQLPPAAPAHRSDPIEEQLEAALSDAAEAA